MTSEGPVASGQPSMTPRILRWEQIAAVLEGIDLIAAMAEGFDAYARGEAVIPPVAEMQFDAPPGDVHIKYGYLRAGRYYVVKIASGFYENPGIGVPSSQGLMLLFCQRTGQLAAVLLDEGKLTDIRTGAAGALAARCLAPARPGAIGILGAGIQARRQLEQLRAVTDCRQVVAWGRSAQRLAAYLADARALGFEARAAEEPAELAAACRLIVTTTPAREPLLRADWIQPGTHITAVGSDAPEKQELDVEILSRADRVVADSRAQCRLRGEIARALGAGALAEDAVIALGDVVAGRAPGRTSQTEVTVADLTGVAVQDLMIATAVFQGAGGQ